MKENNKKQQKQQEKRQQNEKQEIKVAESHSAIKNFVSFGVVFVVLLSAILISLWLRTLSYSQVFVGDWIKMTGVDAYYYMRLLDNLMANFPHLLPSDPGFLYPEGWNTGTNPNFFVYFMGIVIWLINLGNINPQTVDAIAVYIPPFLAVLTIVTVFFIGKIFWNKWLGLFAACLLAVMPGEFLNRSLLGYTDHHIMEVVLSTLMMMFVFLAIKNTQGKTLEEMRKGGIRGFLPAMWGLLGGLFLWLYVMTWLGASLFVLILFSFIVIQSIIENSRGKSSDYLGVLGVCFFGICLILYSFSMMNTMTIISLLAGIIVSILLIFVSRFFIARKIDWKAYPLLIGALGGLSILILYIVSPVLLQSIWSTLMNIFLWNDTTTVMEMQSLLMQQGQFTWLIATGNYLLSFFVALLAIIILIYQMIKKGKTEVTLLLIWSVVILLSTLAMRRFSYYYAVNVALLTGYCCWLVLDYLIKKRESYSTVAMHGSTKNIRRIESKKKSDVRVNTFLIGLSLVVIVLFIYYPNFGPLPDGKRPSIEVATSAQFAPSNVWCETEEWLRANTPDPLGNNKIGYQTGFEYPADAYSVLLWWDYGYLTAREGKRIPTSNPGTGNRLEASYFVAQNEKSADRLIENLGVRYVIADNEIAAYNSKFHALASLGSDNSSYVEYYDVFVQNNNGQYEPVVLFYPKYYYSMITRLYSFDGKAVTPDVVNVILCGKILDDAGKEYKEIIEVQKFVSYEEAQQFISNNQEKKYIIIGDDPSKSPVPLEELKEYSLIYSSKQTVTFGSTSKSAIKVFEYKKDPILLMGNWNGNKTEIGLWRDRSLFYQNDNISAQIGPFGYFSDVPISGDWNGDGKTEIGVWRPSTLCFYLDYNNNGVWDLDSDKKIGPLQCGEKIEKFCQYRSWDVPLSGDWDGDGKDEIGIWSRDIDNAMLGEKGDGKLISLSKRDFGKKGIPISGDWNGDEKDELGVWDPASCYFYLDKDSDGVWKSDQGDLKIGPCGKGQDTPSGGNMESLGVWDPDTLMFEKAIE